jgi:predicted ATPase
MGILALQAGPGEEARRTGRQSAGADGQSAPPPTAAGETAEAAFREALEIARRQRAKSFELRAATSLSRLWAGQGREKDARALLSDVYGWFTEGLDTADLREAKALLAGLVRTAAVRSRSR